MNITIKRKHSMLRSLYFKDRPLANIIFYRDDKRIYESNCGWLENGRKDILSLTMETPKKALKENLSRKDNFYMSSTDTDKEKRFVLYIYADGVNFQLTEPKEIVGSNTDTETWYQNEVTLKSPHMSQQGCRLNDREKLEYFEETVLEVFLRTRYSRKVTKEFGEKVNAMQAFLLEHQLDLSNYNVKKLLTLCNVTIK